MMMSPAGNGAPGGRRFILPLIFVAALFAVVWWRAPGDSVKQERFTGPVMGTTWSAVVVVPRDFDLTGIDEVIARALTQVDQAMSTYKPDSELMRLNRHPVGRSMPLSEGLRVVLERAQHISAATGGAFDITVGPLVEAWGFGASRPGREPTEEEIQTLAETIGWEGLELSEAGATRLREGVRLDLSAIAKGYGADRAAVALEERGIHRYLVEVGGEIRARGRNGEGRPWQVGVEKPDALTRESLAVIGLERGGMATSGDYRQYREVDGKRLSHTIDPRTARPIEHRLASVTVLAEECVTADAWATALSVLGPDEGLKVANEAGVAAFMLVRTAAGDFETRESESFADWMAGPREKAEGTER